MRHAELVEKGHDGSHGENAHGSDREDLGGVRVWRPTVIRHRQRQNLPRVLGTLRCI